MKNCNIDVDATSTVNDVVGVLQQQGIVRLARFFDSAAIASLNKEFEKFLSGEGGDATPNVVERDEATTVPVIRKKLDMAKFPTTNSVFGSKFMNEIAAKYLDGEEFGLNHQVYVNLNRGTEAPVTHLPFIPHFDKISTLKFFVYLTDTDEANGAMKAVPGSHHQNRLDRASQDLSDQPMENIRPDSGLISIDGDAGTLFIFDTDMTHAAGFVEKNFERRIMRGHTRTIHVLAKHGLSNQA